ncbi:MAG: hypothetical protein ACXVX9_06125 [Mycobacteriaceae bacterium]
MAGPYRNDPYRTDGTRNGGGQPGPEPTQPFPQQGAYQPPPQAQYPQQPSYEGQAWYGPSGAGPGGPSGPKRRNLAPWVGGGAAIAVIIIIGLILYFTVLKEDDPTVVAAQTTSATASATSGARVSAVPPQPSSLGTPTKRTATTTTATPTTTPAASGNVPANAEQTQQITTLAKALVEGISKGDSAALAQITCGALAEQVKSGTTAPNPTVYDHVENVLVSPAGTSGNVDVFAYTAKKGPPAKAVTFALQNTVSSLQSTASVWKACSVIE